jgi:hypothetical protein
VRTLDRQAVVAHRAAVHGLHGNSGLDLLEIGVQDAPSGSAEHGLAVRTGNPASATTRT